MAYKRAENFITADKILIIPFAFVISSVVISLRLFFANKECVYSSDSITTEPGCAFARWCALKAYPQKLQVIGE